jgi:broad specificity phosphatase PhoE
MAKFYSVRRNAKSSGGKTLSGEVAMPIGPPWSKRLAISAAALALLIILGCVLFFWSLSPTIVLVVRHAERSDTVNCDPATVKGSPNRSLITVSGQSPRGGELAHVGGEDSIAAIYASEFCRTQQTVQPLATQLGLTVNIVDQYAADGPTPNVDNLISQVRANNKGQVVLIAGHSDTVPAIIERLSGQTIATIGEDEFDNLFVVTIPRWWGKPKVVRLKYGEPT